MQEKQYQLQRRLKTLNMGKEQPWCAFGRPFETEEMMLHELRVARTSTTLVSYEYRGVLATLEVVA
jgi:hypothetical protein